MYLLLILLAFLPLNLHATCSTSTFEYENGNLTCFNGAANTKLPKEILTVGSYNLFGLSNPIALKKDLAQLQNVSIWAFQEVIGNMIETVPVKLLQILPKGKWYIYIKPINLESGNTWEGQAIVSRYPFLKTQVIDLNHSNDRERAALIGHFVNYDGKQFVIINTDHEVTLFGTTFEDRKKQLQSLAAYTSKLTSASIVITGDMNTTGGDEEILLTENFLVNYNFIRARPDYKDKVTFKKLFITQELDHIFYRNLTASKRFRFSGRTGSDHFPIFAHIHL